MTGFQGNGMLKSYGNAPRVSLDKFGNPYQLISCKDKKESGFSKGHVTLGGKLYKIEPSIAQKEGVSFWVKITQLKKQANATM